MPGASGVHPVCPASSVRAWRGRRRRSNPLWIRPSSCTLLARLRRDRPRGACMLARVRTAALWGLDAFPVDCEVDVGPGLPGFVMVGLPDATAREARERVWPALRNIGLAPPDRRVTVNLAPADRRKEGASADLALAMGLLVATEQAPIARLGETAAIGELALDGALRGTRGTLSLAE